MSIEKRTGEAGSLSNTSRGKRTDGADRSSSDLPDGTCFGQVDIPKDRPDATSPVGRFSKFYNMQHPGRGLAIIIAYSEYGLGGPGKRKYAQHDVEICTATFKKLQYEVQVHMNLTKQSFERLINEVRDYDHSNNDSLVVVFMGHGDFLERTNLEYLWTYDSMINTCELWKKFTPKDCPSLAGKPKMFFIQACRGSNTDAGVLMKTPGDLFMTAMNFCVQGDAKPTVPEENYVISKDADMLMMWASYPGTPAFNTAGEGIHGAVFIHYLTKVLDEDAHEDDLVSMLTRVSREVSICFESYCPNKDTLHNNKQMPMTQSTLMRKVHFFPPGN